MSAAGSLPAPAYKARTRRLSPRQHRATVALLAGPLTREQLDRVACCSNGPAVVAGLRGKGIEIHCDRLDRIDRDGQTCHPGIYSLTATGRITALQCLQHEAVTVVTGCLEGLDSKPAKWMPEARPAA